MFLFLSCAACSTNHGIIGRDGPISVLKFDSVLLFEALHVVHAALSKMVALLPPQDARRW